MATISEMAVISEITAFLTAILFLLGLVFVVWKIINKQSQKKDRRSSARIYAKIEKPLYILHLSASAVASILSIIHGIAASPVNLVCKYSGLISAILTHLMFIMGVIMGLKNKMKPYGSEQDAANNKARTIKWILTGITLITLGVHFISHFL